jgi:Glycosyl hydrolase family 63 C-terminal domain
MTATQSADAETRRLEEDSQRVKNWRRWGPYLSERQWSTVREDYSADGSLWDYFPHEQARSRAYRWGEDGLLGICDRECRLCFALALWNGRDPILKERLFGLTNSEGNHAEDVKECYFYLDATPTNTYLNALYKYPQAEFPYDRLRDENRRRGRGQPEFELTETNIFDAGQYFDIFAEYAKADADDILIRLTAVNRGPEAARLHLLPVLWFRNTWSWGARDEEGHWPKPRLWRSGPTAIDVEHVTLGRFRLSIEGSAAGAPTLLFTENETNAERLFGTPNGGRYFKDGFDDYVIHGRTDAVNPEESGTKAAVHHVLDIPAGSQQVVQLRLAAVGGGTERAFGPAFDSIFEDRREEADAFYAARIPQNLSDPEKNVTRQAYAGLLWSRQFYHYVVPVWLHGDPAQPAPPKSRAQLRNADWRHLYCRDVLSVPDKWEYPGFFAWDLAFHMLVFARIDPEFAKRQLILLLREWYLHPNGQLPASEYDLADVNPPVHAWACWRVYKICGAGCRDRRFLASAFHKLLLNFTWWVNRKDPAGHNVFAGGFLGLDNIGVFDRSRPLPTGDTMQQADGTAWMGFFCLSMLAIAMELAREEPEYEDMASKFFEHFIAIADSLNNLGGTGLWDEEDGFYYDHLMMRGQPVSLKVRSLVGFIPLLAVEVLDEEAVRRLPRFAARMRWFLENRRDQLRYIGCLETREAEGRELRLLALPTRARLVRALRYMLDESEFLSPHGVRSLSRFHLERPYTLRADGREHRVAYVPGDSDSGQFGGNSNWRGPVWLPINYLLLEALERYHHFYGDSLRVECPTGSGRLMNLLEVARELAERTGRLFRPDAHGNRPWHGADRRFAEDPHWRDLVQFYEYFHGDTGSGLGASHQTGWTALITRLLEDCARRREQTEETRAGTLAGMARP